MQNGKTVSVKQLIVIIAVVVIIAAAAIVGVVLYLSANRAPIAQNERISGTATIITEENADQANAQSTNESFTAWMNAIWSFDDGQSPSANAFVGNYTDNTRPFFFEVILEDSNELVYTSPVVPIGAQLKDLVLDVPLKKGKYTAVCAYNLLDENEEVVNVVSFGVTLDVLR